MPNTQTIKRHGGVRSVRRRKIDANTVLIVYTFSDGKKYQETRRMVPTKKRTKKSVKKQTYFPR